MDNSLAIGYLILGFILGVIAMRQIHRLKKKKVAAVFVTTTIEKKDKGRVITVPDIRMDWTDAALLAVAPTDTNGNPAPVADPVWTSSDSNVTIETSTDGKKAYAVPADNFVTEPDIAVQVTFSCDADLGAGVETLSVVWNIFVDNPRATQLNPASSTLEKAGRPPLG